MLNKIAHILSDRMNYFVNSSAQESVYNVYVDMVRGQMNENEN